MSQDVTQNMNDTPDSIGFRMLADEIHIEEVPVRGTIPTWFHGTLLRTGPAKFEVGNHRYNHWFDGLVMLHSIYEALARVEVPHP